MTVFTQDALNLLDTILTLNKTHRGLMDGIVAVHMKWMTLEDLKNRYGNVPNLEALTLAYIALEYAHRDDQVKYFQNKYGDD